MFDRQAGIADVAGKTDIAHVAEKRIQIGILVKDIDTEDSDWIN